jgi:U4/U6.U5 tri-snRNP-associated protein 1
VCTRLYQDEDQSDEEGGLGASAAELAGMKVKHSADEVGEGETIILTLADKQILDDKGELVEDDDEELENVLAVSAP